MFTHHAEGKVDEDGVLHLDLAIGHPGTEYEIIVVLRTKAANEPSNGNWPPGFIESTAGSWVGDFVRDQGRFQDQSES